MIHFHTLRSTDDQHWSSFVDTYTSSFPLDEQRPTDSIAQLLTSEERFTAIVLLDKNNSFVGILTTWTFDTFIYIEHFALHLALRSQGYGSIALQTFIQHNTLPIILEVEPPTDTLTQRRVSFYERCGLRLYNYPYIQPPYTPELSAVPLRLMGTLPLETPLSTVAEQLHREVYGVSDKSMSENILI